MTITIPLSEVKQCFKKTLEKVLTLLLATLILVVMFAVVTKFPNPNLQTTNADLFFGIFVGWFTSSIALYIALKEDFEEFLESWEEAEKK